MGSTRYGELTDPAESGSSSPGSNSTVQRQKAASIYFTSKQILPFAFAEQIWYSKAESIIFGMYIQVHDEESLR